MRVQLACQALKDQKRLELAYDGWSRIIEVHAVGFTKQGRAVMRVWQTSGGSSGKEPVGWKLLGLDEVLEARICVRRSGAPRPGYKRDDRAIERIVCQV